LERFDMGRLTVAMVRQAKARAIQYEESDKADGLVLVVFPSGRKSWAVRYRNDAGKQRKVTLGPVDQLSLGDARNAAKELMLRIAKGDDPSAKAKTDDPETTTVKAASETFMVDRRAQDKNRAADEVQRQFDAYILPAIGDSVLSKVTGPQVRKIVLARVTEGSRIMANRVHATLARFFKWAADRDRALIEANPYSGYGKPVDESGRGRERTLSNVEIAALWREAGKVDQPFGPIVRLLILTGQRRSEVTGMTDREIDPTRAEWIIPSDRAKNGDRHTVPLSPPAMAELAKVKRIGKGGLVFTTNGESIYAGHHKAKSRLDAQLQFNEAWRLHDIRRTVATGLAALGVTAPVVEAILNHRTGSRAGVAGVYNRHAYADEMELALIAWGRFIVDVVAIDRRRIAFDGMRARDKPPFNVAIQSDDEEWSEYLATLDTPADEREAA
jgi:integrase